LDFRIRTVAAGRTNLFDALAARRPKSALPSEPLLNSFAGARERAGTRLSTREQGSRPK
jgi:hypothetical protein